MKIVILGWSGSGKSTLARRLSEFYQLPLLHLDSIWFLPNWVEREKEEFHGLIQDFMRQHENWIIEGNYTKHVPERFLEADMILFLNYNRFTCLRSVIHRYKAYKNKTRPDMAIGCEEKLDLDFLWHVFYKGRKRKKRKYLIKLTTSAKTGIIFKNRKALELYLKKLGVEEYGAGL